ncbi:putative ATP-dependent Clp protease, ATP-binding subunit ClpX [delta proteobacterium NaphS2]|nr:putative ATP-dependent Clp protease, ATP-binding subunit ClpX [delta proteobacterium NaphS2]
MEEPKTKKIENEKAGKLPNQQELEKELGEYLSKKYGDRVKIISPFVVPQKDENDPKGKKPGSEDSDMENFSMMPEEMASYLDGFVVKQDQVKAVLGTKICTHFNRIRFNDQKESESFSGADKKSGVGMIKNNVLMIGPTGVGKTYMIKLIAQKLGVPFVKGDATKFSETGYVGGDVEDLIRDLVYEADESIELAENGIVYIDEIDKISSSRNLIGHDVSRTGVQRALLKPMEETDVDLKVPHDPISQIQAIEHYRRTGKKEKKVVNTKNILFIMSGAFGDLAEIIKKRLQRQGIGFEADVRPTEIPWEILKEVRAQDLVEFGFESEFVGRLPVVVVFDMLNREDLFEILKNPNNPIIISKRMDFRAYGIDIKFEDDALRQIAALAENEKTGARGLVSAIEKVLVPFETRLPSTEIKRFLVTPEVVDNPEQQLSELLEKHNDPEWIARFEKARSAEVTEIKQYIEERAEYFSKKSGLEMYDQRLELIAHLYLQHVTDIDVAIENLGAMYEQVQAETDVLRENLDVKILFDDSAVDEIIRQAVDSGQNVRNRTFQLAKRLEYGLRLVKDRVGKEDFIIDRKALADMEAFISGLMKKAYHSEEACVNEKPEEKP